MKFLVSGLMLLFSAFAFAQSPMTIKVEGLREAKGQLMVFVYDNADDFPTKRDRAKYSKKIPVSGASMEVVFDAVPAGTYGVAVYHDENMNDKMDRSWYGMPTEGYGASNDAKGSFGPPKFDDAKFDFNESYKSVKIIIHY